MPGFTLHDVGDMIRTGAASCAEDEGGSDSVAVQHDLFEALVRGFDHGSGGLLLDRERAHIVTAAQVVTFEMGLRFLTDYLDGDRYYRVHRPCQNLDRARTQFALVRYLLENEAVLTEIAERSFVD